VKNQVEIVRKIEGLLEELKISLGGASRGIPRRSKVVSEWTFKGLTGEIHNLVQEGFFKDRRTLGEIQKKLRLEGVNKPTTALMRPLVLLIKKKILRRSTGADGKGPYKYDQR
jgi:hypothetical protein